MARASYVFETQRALAARALLVFAIASLLLGGCSHFVPSPARPPITSEGLRARVVKLDGYVDEQRGRFGSRVFLHIDDAPLGTRVANARLVAVKREPPERMPCETGALAERIVVDGDVHRREVRADAELRLDFLDEKDAKLDEEPTRVDLVIDDGSHARCMEVELTSTAPDKAWEYESPFFVGMAQTYEAHTSAVSGADWAVRVLFMGGKWLGSVRLSGGVGFMDAGCSFCSPNPKGKARGSSGLALTLRADVFPIEAGHFAFGYSVRYSFSTLDQFRGAPDDQTTTLAAYHELGIAPLAAFAYGHPINAMGFHVGPRSGSAGIELPIGVATPLNDYRHPALAIGGGVFLIF